MLLGEDGLDSAGEKKLNAVESVIFGKRKKTTKEGASPELFGTPLSIRALPVLRKTRKGIAELPRLKRGTAQKRRGRVSVFLQGFQLQGGGEGNSALMQKREYSFEGGRFHFRTYENGDRGKRTGGSEDANSGKKEDCSCF